MAKKLIRPIKGRKIAGVCMAFSNYFDVDITLVRLIAVVLLLSGGLPGLSYLICWLVIPSEK